MFQFGFSHACEIGRQRPRAHVECIGRETHVHCQADGHFGERTLTDRTLAA
jgi:hypothetical protein